MRFRYRPSSRNGIARLSAFCALAGVVASLSGCIGGDGAADPPAAVSREDVEQIVSAVEATRRMIPSCAGEATPRHPFAEDVIGWSRQVFLNCTLGLDERVEDRISEATTADNPAEVFNREIKEAESHLGRLEETLTAARTSSVAEVEAVGVFMVHALKMQKMLNETAPVLWDEWRETNSSSSLSNALRQPEAVDLWAPAIQAFIENYGRSERGTCTYADDLETGTIGLATEVTRLGDERAEEGDEQFITNAHGRVVKMYGPFAHDAVDREWWPAQDHVRARLLLYREYWLHEGAMPSANESLGTALAIMASGDLRAAYLAGELERRARSSAEEGWPWWPEDARLSAALAKMDVWTTATCS